MKKKTRDILMLCFIAVFLVSAYQIYKIKKDYQTAADTYSDLAQYISFTEPAPISQDQTAPTVPTESTVTASGYVDDTNWPNINFEALQEINPDIVGWLYIEGTQINYPVVQGSDNGYYLEHLFDNTYNPAGCIFLDAFGESDFTEMNSVIYGHHMKDGTMFSDLMNYKQQEFYDEHTAALLITPTHRYQLLFFSGYVATTTADAWKIDFSAVSYGEWLEELSEKSCFVSTVFPSIENRVVTLSTCSYEFNNARFVLHGIIQACDSNVVYN